MSVGGIIGYARGTDVEAHSKGRPGLTARFCYSFSKMTGIEYRLFWNWYVKLSE